jgi:hypothetical protein
LESRTSNAVGRCATSTQASSLALKLLFRQPTSTQFSSAPPLKLLFLQATESVKCYSKVAAISATNLTEFSSLMAMLSSSTITRS